MIADMEEEIRKVSEEVKLEEDRIYTLVYTWYN